MSSLFVGEHPTHMTVVVVQGSTADLVVPADTGVLAAPVLEFTANRSGEPSVTHALVLESGEWVVHLSSVQVAALAGLHFARVKDSGRVVAAGQVQHNPGWHGRSESQVVTTRIIWGGGGGGASTWDAITGKPTTFPPTGHTHDDRYYTEAEVDALIAAIPGGGGGGSTFTVTDTPTKPAEGSAASFWVSSAVAWPAGLVWSDDPDGGVAPTITSLALVSMLTVGGTTYAVAGSTFTYVAPPDTEAPAWSAILTTGTPTTTSVVVSASALATDNVGVTGYERSLDSGSTWAAITPSGLDFTLTGLAASTAYPAPRFRAKDAAGNYSTVLSAQAFTTAAPPADSTPPTPGTLAGSNITGTSFTLTVTGASDAGAGLHATPYRFSTDNGASYSAWQASNVYAATGKAAGTGYQCLHQVRDAAATPNVATGAAITVTTSAPSVVLASDTFNRANGPLASSISDGPGALVWVPATNMTIASNMARGTTLGCGALNVGQANQKVTVTFGASTDGGGVILRSNANLSLYWRCIWFTDGKWYLTCFINGTANHRHIWSQAAPVAGDTMTVQAVTNGANVDFKVWHNAALLKEHSEHISPYSEVAGTHAGMFGVSTDANLDNFVCETP